MFAARNNQPIDVIFPANGISVFESHHGPSFHMPATRVNYLKVVYVLKGSGRVEGQKLSGAVAINKGDLVVVPPQMLHAFNDDPESHPAFIVLCIRGEVLKLCPSALLKLDRPCLLRNDALKREGDRLLRRLFFEQFLKRAACSEMMTGLTVQLLATIARVRQGLLEQHQRATAPLTAPEARVHAYIRDLEERYFETEKIDNVAARLGMSRRSFTSIFRRLAGKSWLDHIREVRLRYAKALLLSADHTTLWVALECGFQDLSTFYRTFHAAEGVTPQQWKAAHEKRRKSPGLSARVARR